LIGIQRNHCSKS